MDAVDDTVPPIDRRNQMRFVVNGTHFISNGEWRDEVSKCFSPMSEEAVPKAAPKSSKAAPKKSPKPAPKKSSKKRPAANQSHGVKKRPAMS